MGIGDYSELIIGVATETRKSCLPPLLYSGGLVFSMSVSVENYYSCFILWDSRFFTVDASLFILVHNTGIKTLDLRTTFRCPILLFVVCIVFN